MQLSQTEAAAQKSELRRKFIEARALITQADAEYKSRALCAAVYKEIELKRPSTVLAFAPTRREPDVLPLCRELIAQGVRVAFPISDAKNIRLDFRYVGDIRELVKGTYGIYEPHESCESANTASESTVCLVPALAIDRHGMRLGYGKGYYDRFLESFCGLSIGVVFSDFLVGELPHGKYDIATDMIITEGEVIVPDEDALTFQKKK
jgi:5-formyltetrahydrofolate cyclo-ligase